MPLELSLPPTLSQSSQLIYFVRHGETAFNTKNIVQGGGVDSDLNEKGHWQAQRFFEHYQRVKFDMVFCSGLKRAQQSMQPFVKNGHSLYINEGFNEMNWGCIEGLEQDERIRKLFEESVQQWNAGNFDYKIEGAESPLETWKRLSQALREAILLSPKGTLLICTHGRSLRILLSMLLGYGMERMNWFQHSNTGVNILVRTGHKFYAERLNDVSHLDV